MTELMTDDPVILYIIFPEHVSRRLTPGQIAAQAAHAATMLVGDGMSIQDWDRWTHGHAFGITLIGVTDVLFHPYMNYVTDPYVHFPTGTEYNVVTCGFLFCRRSEFPEEINFKLLTDEYLVA